VGRLLISFALVAAATVVGFVALTSNWAQNEALDTDAWVEISSDLLADETIRREVATEIAAQTGLGDSPEAQVAIEAAISNPRFEPLWRAANQQAHALLVAVVEEDPAAGSLGADGAGAPLELDLTPAADQLAGQLGLPPGSVGEIKLDVIPPDELEAIRGANDALSAVAIASLVGAVLLYGLALVVAPAGRRRSAALAVSGSVVLVGALTLLVRSSAAESAIDAFDATAETRDAVERAWLIATEDLARLATILVVAGSIGIAAVAVTWWLSRDDRRRPAYE
jgi:hypothetical protein